MKLVRIATVSFDQPLKHAEATLNVADVSVSTRVTTLDREASDRVLAVAMTSVSLPINIDDDRYVVVPEAERSSCETAIEMLANVLAVANHTGRVVSSAHPCVAFTDVPDVEREKLDRSRGFRSGTLLADPVASVDLSEDAVVQALADREAAVALLAEVLSTEHAVARYRELVRFFEHAFARSLHDLEYKLSQFLTSADRGYTRSEVQTRVTARHGAIHGDKQGPTDLVMERDVRHLLPRMEQAAYDVLFNKAVWNDPSRVRRDGLRFDTATKSANTKVVEVQRGSTPILRVQLLDPFGAYPINLEGNLTSPPEEWWWRPPRSITDTA